MPKSSRGGKRGVTATQTPTTAPASVVGSTSTAPTATQTPIQNQAPTPQNTPVVPNAVNKLSQMTDAQLAQLYRQSQSVDMPNHLNDASDATQKFVYAAGINEKPIVLNQAAFDQYLKDNKIRKSDVLARSTGGASYSVNGTSIQLSPTQVTDLIKYGDLTYVGGKHGGQVYGAGTYFARNGGRPTGYAGTGGQTMLAVLNPQTAKPIDKYTLGKRAQTFAQSHPQFARSVGQYRNSNASIYALAMGYNVITDGANDYHNVIDRSAIVVRAENY